MTNKGGTIKPINHKIHIKVYVYPLSIIDKLSYRQPTGVDDVTNPYVIYIFKYIGRRVLRDFWIFYEVWKLSSK